MLNLSVVLEDSARKHANSTAFTFMEISLTYVQINALANQVAGGLREVGIKKGDKVALSCPNLPYFPIVYYGILKAGAIVVPLSVLLKKDEISYHLRDSHAKAYFCFQDTADLPMGEMGYEGFKASPICEHFFMIMSSMEMDPTIDNVPTLSQLIADQPPVFDTIATNADDTAVIVYTSGTTGRPKGAELTHSNLLINAMLSTDLSTAGLGDRQLVVLPLFHIFAMTVLMNGGVYRGVTSILLTRFDPEAAFGLMQKHEVNIFAGVPTMFWGLLHYDDPKFDYEKIASHLKVCCSGGASLPLTVLEGFEKRFNVDIMEGYGMSEGSPVVTFTQPQIGRKPGSVGTPMWGVEVKVVDQDGNEVKAGEKGELIYRGHNVMKGYFKKPEANKETIRNGWLYSGDIAVKDEDGFFFIVDRTKDMIIRGGLNVYPREIEEVMIKHKAISLVAVIGVPDEKLGEEVKAFVVLEEGKQAGEDEIREWVKNKIAGYKYPRQIEIVEALPMTATGKILKKELKKEYSNT